ncbi:MAG: hypothetical protein RLZZ68_1745 [Bacteroidota bacterium]
MVTFNTVGQYTVTLTASNAQGNDSEVKNNYITVVQNTGPCAAAADTCDEYIKTFLLNTINNNSNTCTAGGYADYTNISTTLAKGTAYSATVVPGIIGQAGNIAYTGDELAIWIDYNNDNDFVDAGEQFHGSYECHYWVGAFTNANFVSRFRGYCALWNGCIRGNRRLYGEHYGSLRDRRTPS